MARLQVPNFEKDVVYLFQFAGTENVSSLSPFCIKAEAFCRLHNLKFERIDTTSARGSNGLLPFIELNGVQIADSQVILRRLTEHFQLKNYADARSEGLGHALERMIENHMLHLVRFDMGRCMNELIRMILKERVPGFLMPLVASLGAWAMRRKMRGVLRTAVGPFTEAEYDEMLRNDLLQLQNVLDGNQFLMGNEPSKVDCVALAHIGNAYYLMPNAKNRLHEFLDTKELSPMKEYLERVKTRLFAEEFKKMEKK